jgi:2-haloacid dehalogenase
MSTPATPRPLPAAAVFDAYGTLFDLASATRPQLGRLGARAGELADVWRAKQLEYTWLRSLMADAWVPFETIVQQALDYAMAHLNLEDAGLRAALLQAFRRLAPYPEVPAVLARLRAAGVPTAILSNGSRDMLDAAVRAAGLDDYLDAVLSVDDVEVFKPHPRVYQLALDRFGLTAEDRCRVSFQSANAWDAAGAAHFGFDVVWCNRSGAAPERLPAAPAAEVVSLDGLLARYGLEADAAPT